MIELPHIGSWGLPDFGVTEKIQEYFYPNTTRTQEGGSNLLGTGSASDQVAVADAYSQEVASTGTPSSGGGYTTSTVPTSTVPTSTEPIPINSVLEPTPEQEPDPFEAEINQAIGDLQALEPQFNQAFSGQIANIDQSAQASASGIEADRSSREREFITQQDEARLTGRTARAREDRMASEVMQGLQSRFGGRGGIGQFAGELVGRQVLENISNIRNTVLMTVQKIEDAKQRINDKAVALRAQIFAESEGLKERARAELNDNILRIRSMTSELRGKKGDMAMQALNAYRQTVTQINMRNARFLQDVSLAASQGQLQLTNFQNTARDRYEAQIKNLSHFNMGSLSMVPQDYGRSPAATQTGFVNTNTQTSEDDEWDAILPPVGAGTVSS